MSGLRFDHIAVAVPRIADAMPFLVGVLGGVSSFGMLRDVFAMAHWTFEGGGRLELLEPIGADGFVHRFIATRGAGIHHVTFKVPSLDEACRRAEARGYRIIGRDETDPAWQEAFLHPRQALGIVVQFAQAGPVEGPRPERTAAPPMPATPPAPVRVLGLRMRAHSRERALAQWRDVALGEPVDERGLLVFRWPGSPMRVAVEIDPTGEQGPLFVEIASKRPLDLPEGPHPVLGARFVLVP